MPQPIFQPTATRARAIDRLLSPANGSCGPAVRWLSVPALVAQLCLFSVIPPPVVAQEVFVTRGAGSPVFSDKPQPGAKPVNLPPINVAAPVPVAKDVVVQRPAEEGGKPAPVTHAYRNFRILSPEDNGSVAANTALFDVRVAVEPPLQLAAGHAIEVSVNGQPVGQRFTASEFTIPPEFWGDTLPPANQRQQLDAVIVDRNGEVVEAAKPVTFVVRYVAGSHGRPPWHGPGYGPGYGPGQSPGYRPRPTPLPSPVERPKPPPAQPFDPWEKKFEREGLRFYEPPAQPGRGGGR